MALISRARFKLYEKLELCQHSGKILSSKSKKINKMMSLSTHKFFLYFPGTHRKREAPPSRRPSYPLNIIPPTSTVGHRPHNPPFDQRLGWGGPVGPSNIHPVHCSVTCHASTSAGVGRGQREDRQLEQRE